MSELERVTRLLNLPYDVRCVNCGGYGNFLETDRTPPSRFVGNRCMQCAGTGVGVIPWSELFKNARLR